MLEKIQKLIEEPLKEKEINKGGTAPWRPCDHLFVCLGEEEHD